MTAVQVRSALWAFWLCTAHDQPNFTWPVISLVSTVHLLYLARRCEDRTLSLSHLNVQKLEMAEVEDKEATVPMEQEEVCSTRENHLLQHFVREKKE